MSCTIAGDRTLSRAILLLGLLTGFASGLRGEGIRLLYSSTAGDKSTYNMIMEGSTTVFVGDRTQKSSIKTEMFLTQSVAAFKEEVITLKTKIDSGSINVNGQPSPIPMIGQEVLT